MSILRIAHVALFNLKPIFQNWVCIGHQTQMKSTQKKCNVHCQRENFALGTQRNLYFTDLRWGLALGVTHILSLAFGEMQILAFLDTNMLV